MRKPKILPMLIYVLVMAALFSWSMGIFGSDDGDIPYSEVVALFRSEQVKNFQVEDETITLNLHAPYDGKTKLTATLADADTFRLEMHDLFLEQKDAGILERL